MKTLDEQLEALGVLFKQHDSAAQTSRGKASAAVSTHPDLGKLWAWGQAPAMFAEGALGFDEEQRWLTAAESAATLKGLLRDVPEFTRTFVPLSTDDAGNYTCLDAATGHVMDWDHETRQSRLYSRSLAAFLEPRRTRAARALRERAAQAKAAAAPRKPPPAAGAQPTKIKRVPQANLNRYDSAGYSGGMRKAALSPDGRLVAMANTRSVLWDLQAGSEIALGYQPHRPEALAFDPTGQRLLIASNEGVFVVDTATGQTVHAWEQPEPYATRTAGFTPDGALVHVLMGSQVAVWSAAKLPRTTKKPGQAAPLAALPAPKGGEWKAMSLADDGTMLVLDTSYGKGLATLWNPPTGETLLAQRFKGSLGGGAALSPDGKQAALLIDHELCVFDVGKKLTLRHKAPLQLRRSDIATLAFDRTGQTLVSCGDQEVKLWDAASGKLLATTPAKSKNHAPVVTICTVTADLVLTVEPLALFELR